MDGIYTKRPKVGEIFVDKKIDGSTKKKEVIFKIIKENENEHIIDDDDDNLNGKDDAPSSDEAAPIAQNLP